MYRGKNNKMIQILHRVYMKKQHFSRKIQLYKSSKNDTVSVSFINNTVPSGVGLFIFMETIIFY